MATGRQALRRRNRDGRSDGTPPTVGAGPSCPNPSPCPAPSADPSFDLAADGLGTNGWGEASSGGYGIGGAITVEHVLTALLVMVVLAATARTSNAAVAGVPIGLALVVAHLVAVPVDGTSVNPARSLGPALLSGGTALSQVWLFVLVPLVGAVVGALLHRVLWSADDGHAAVASTSTPDPTTPGSRR